MHFESLIHPPPFFTAKLFHCVQLWGVSHHKESLVQVLYKLFDLRMLGLKDFCA